MSSYELGTPVGGHAVGQVRLRETSGTLNTPTEGVLRAVRLHNLREEGGHSTFPRESLQYRGTLVWGSVTPVRVSHTYRGTSLINNNPPVGPYSSPMPWDLW